MAWLSSVSWVTGDTPVLATVLNNIGADIRTWGGGVDAAGFNLANVGTLSAALVGSGTGSPTAAFHGLRTDGGYQFKAERTGSNAHVYGWAVSSGTGALVIDDVTNGASRLAISTAGVVSIYNTPAYANNAAAISGGLAAGALYTVTGSNPRQLAVVF